MIGNISCEFGFQYRSCIEELRKCLTWSEKRCRLLDTRMIYWSLRREELRTERPYFCLHDGLRFYWPPWQGATRGLGWLGLLLSWVWFNLLTGAMVDWFVFYIWNIRTCWVCILLHKFSTDLQRFMWCWIKAKDFFYFFISPHVHSL